MRWIAALVLLLFSFSPAASAHTMPSSAVALHFLADEVRADMTLPLDRLEVAFDRPLATAELIAQNKADVQAYLRSHLSVSAPDGTPWHITMGDFAVQESGGQKDLLVSFHLKPAEGDSLRQFTLHNDIILKELATHSILVSIQTDWNNGIFQDNPLLIGTLQMDKTAVTVDQADGAWYIGLGDVMEMGMTHISEGFDHLLFLFTLLLPSYAVRRDGKWRVRGSVMQVVKVVTAFTIGHSITLLLATLGWIEVNTQIVEILVALSIIISSMHVLFPLFPKREPWIAGGFGLIHGMAFSNTLIEMGLRGKQLLLSVLGFNIGIELMQLGIIAITVPWLLLLSMKRGYVYVQRAGAVMAGVFAAGWCAARIAGAENWLSSFADAFARSAYSIPLLLMLLVLVSRLKMLGGK